MELTFVVAINAIWQRQSSWLHPCKVCDQGCSVDKIKFTRNRKMVGVRGLPATPPRTRISNFKQVGNVEKLLKSMTLNSAL